MNTEKGMLRQDLSIQEKPEEIKKFIEDTELMGGHEDIVALAKAKYETAIEQTNTPIETTEGQKTQVENLGDTENGLQEVTAPIDEKIAKKDTEIKNVEVETEQKITEVKIENSIAKNESHYMTEVYSSKEQGLNGLDGLYQKYPNMVKGNKMFDESKPFLSLEANGEKFIIQYNAKYDKGDSVHNPLYIQSFDGQPVHIQQLAAIMGRDYKSLAQEFKNTLS